MDDMTEKESTNWQNKGSQKGVEQVLTEKVQISVKNAEIWLLKA